MCKRFTGDDGVGKLGVLRSGIAVKDIHLLTEERVLNPVQTLLCISGLVLRPSTSLYGLFKLTKPVNIKQYISVLRMNLGNSTEEQDHTENPHEN